MATMQTFDNHAPRHWPAVASASLRVAFGVIWAFGAALTWSPDFAVHYVGYLHNAAHGQPEWLQWWFSMWIAWVTPNVTLFVWLTRIVETLIAVALLVGFARKMLYVVGILFSLLVWSTAEGFGGPYSVGATNMGTAISYVLVFIALIAINGNRGRSPYSLDYLIERLWPSWRRFAEWSHGGTLAREPEVLPWRVQIPAMIGVLALVVLLIGSLHSVLNVKSASPTSAAAAVSPLMLANPEPIAEARDARLPPLLGTGDSVEVHLESTDDTVTIANGVQYKAWTFGGTVPAPVLHVRQGQTVHVTFTNRGTMQHSIDFHAAVTPPNLHYADIMPGETIKFSFVANTPGAFLYHCGTAPALLHIANGMYGALIVDPATPLPPATESYVLVQGEWYTRQIGDHLMAGDWDKMMQIEPDEVVFNGIANQYSDQPLPVTAGGLLRIYFINAGPSLWSAFHVIGGIFDKVYPDGNPANALEGVSTFSVGPGEGAVFDMVLDKPGHYHFVDHSMAHASKGAAGAFAVHGEAGTANAKPPITRAEPLPASAIATAPPEPDGPYQYDADRGEQLYTTYCAACHQANGTGMPGAFPPLKGNSAVLDPNPKSQIEAILHGLQGKEIDGVTYPTAMPPFGNQLNNSQIADIINHERTSWGNQADQVTVEDIQAMRDAVQ